MTEKLKPCPFCGNATPTLIVGFSPIDSSFVDCACGFSSTLFETDKQAVESWNRRAAKPAEPSADLLDAARYRWLRDVGDATWQPFVNREACSAKLVDAAIDASIAQKP